MNHTKILRAVWLLLASAFAAGTICLCVIVALAIGTDSLAPNEKHISAETLAGELSRQNGGYTLSKAGQSALAKYGAWAMLLDEKGDAVWSAQLPQDVPLHYTAADIAGFSRWYLKDYPVMTWRCQENLLVVGEAKSSVWKYSVSFKTGEVIPMLSALPVLFLVLLLVLPLLGRRSFQKEQQKRDGARARWIDGISHDIRTPLSVVMGYAGEWQADAALPAARRRQAESMVAACKGVKALVADLNLTMRLDYEMQPLRRELLSPAALLRAAAADALNTGVAEDAELEIAPEAEEMRIDADAMLVRRALANLIQNAVRHGGGKLALSLKKQKGRCCLCVENTCIQPAEALAQQLSRPKQAPGIARDGTAAHGTGLHLVQQVAKAHHGKIAFLAVGEHTLRAELTLPCARTQSPKMPRQKTQNDG